MIQNRTMEHSLILSGGRKHTVLILGDATNWFGRQNGCIGIQVTIQHQRRFRMMLKLKQSINMDLNTKLQQAIILIRFQIFVK